MSCENCSARFRLAREAYESAKLAQAAKHVAKGAAERFGLKKKTGSAELAAKKAVTQPSGQAGSTPGDTGQEHNDG